MGLLPDVCLGHKHLTRKVTEGSNQSVLLNRSVSILFWHCEMMEHEMGRWSDAASVVIQGYCIRLLDVTFVDIL